MQTNPTEPLARPSPSRWVDVWLFGYLLVIVAVYAAGGQLASYVGSRFGAMPERGGLWTWVWSIDRVGNSQALRLIGLTLAGAVVAGLLGSSLHSARLRRYRPLIWLGLAISGGIVCWYYRVMGSLGDAFSYLVMAGHHVWFKLSQPLSTALFAGAYSLLARLGWPVAPSLALISCLAGALWILTIGLLTRQLPPWPARLLVAAGLLAGGAALFFGYLETTVMVIAVAALYLYFGARVMRGGSLVPAALTLGIVLTLHGQMVYLLPSYLILAWIAYQRAHSQWALLVNVLVILPTVVIMLFAYTHPALTIAGFGDALGGGDNRMFVPLLKIESPMEYYTLFSFNHWTDLLNLALRATPLIGIFLVPAAAGWWTRKNDLTAWFWASIIGGGLSFVLLWNPDLGMPHDWDLFTPPLMLSLIAGAFLWPAGWTPRWGNLWSGAALGFSVAALSVVVSYFTPTGSWDLWATDVRIQHPVNARFGDSIDLLGYDISQTSYAPGETLIVQLYWRTRQALAVDYTAGVYLLQVTDANSRLIAQDDHRPFAFIERYSSEWVSGEIVPNGHAFVIPATTPPGTYQLWAVLYDLNTMQRLFTGPEKNQDHLILASVTVQ